MVTRTQVQEVLTNCHRHHINNVWFQKTSILPPWKVIGNSEGKGCLQAKVLKKESMKQNWNIQRGGGNVQIKKPSMGGYRYFLEQHNL